MNNFWLGHPADDKERKKFDPALWQSLKDSTKGKHQYNKAWAQQGLIHVDTVEYKGVETDILCAPCLPHELSKYAKGYIKQLRLKIAGALSREHGDKWKHVEATNIPKPLVCLGAWWVGVAKEYAQDILGDLAIVIDGQTSTAVRLVEQVGEVKSAWCSNIGFLGYGSQGQLVDQSLFREGYHKCFHIFDLYNKEHNTVDSVEELLEASDIIVSTVSSRHKYQGKIPAGKVVIEDSWPPFFVGEGEG